MSGTLDRSNRRVRILALAALQVELVSLARAKTARENSITQAGRTLGAISHNAARRLLDGKQAFCEGETLRYITDSLGRKDLFQEIQAAAKGLSDRDRGLSAYPQEVIHLVLDLQERYETVKARMRLTQFAGLFGDYAAIVNGAVRGAQKGLDRLRDCDIARAIRKALHSTEWDVAEPDVDTSVMRLSAELDQMAQRLRKALGARESLAAKLGVYRGTLKAAREGRSGLKTLRMLHDRAKAILAKEHSPKSDAIPAPDAQKALDAAEIPQPAGLAALLANGGGTSPLGVPFTFGPNAAEIEIQAAKEFVNFLQWEIRLVRAMMNIAANAKDDASRQAIREALGPEVEELYLTIQAFTAAYPNRLTEMLQAQRDTWAGLRGGKNERKGGGRS